MLRRGDVADAAWRYSLRVLLIATNRHDRLMSRMEAHPLPIGLAYIAGYLDAARHDLRMLDLMFSADYLADVEKTVREFRPDLIGLSIRNLDNGSYLNPQWALPLGREVIQRLRDVGTGTIACGGPAFSLLPEECFRFLEPDLGIAGDGGETFARLADVLEAGEDYHDLPGLVYRRSDGVIVCNGRAHSRLQVEPRLEGLEMTRYQRAGFGIGIVTKLDGGFSTTVEDEKDPEAAGWRVIRPVDEVVREAARMHDRYGMQRVFFIDSAFNVPLDYAKSLCRSLMDAGLCLGWNTYLAPVSGSWDQEVVGLMKQAGCNLVFMKGVGGPGLQTQDVRARLEPLAELCGLCESEGLLYIVSQTFGEPGETRETVEAKLDFLKARSPALANLWVGVRVLPGTPEARLALDGGQIADEAELVRPTFYVSEGVKDWIVDRLKEEASRNPGWNLV